MIIPNRNPWELLVAGKQIEVSSVGGKPPSVVVKSENFVVWLRNAVDRVTPPVVSIFVLIDVITKMNNIVNRVLATRLA
jgi:hypothetical protein